MVESSRIPSFKHTRFLLISSMVLAAALFRLVDHGFQNVSPIGAMALFGGACFATRRTAFGVTFGAMLLSDVLLYSGRYTDWAAISLPTMAFVYVAFAVVVGIGCFLKSRRSAKSTVVCTVAGSVAFFLISNLSAWMAFPEYEKSFSGLMECYVAGLPFFRSTLLGDLCFAGVLFGTWAYIEQRVPETQPSLVS